MDNLNVKVEYNKMKFNYSFLDNQVVLSQNHKLENFTEPFWNSLKSYLKDFCSKNKKDLLLNEFHEIADEYVNSNNISQGFYFDIEQDMQLFIQAIFLAYNRKEHGKPELFFPQCGKVIQEPFVISSEKLHKQRKNITQPALNSNFVIIIHDSTVTKCRKLRDTVNNCIDKRKSRRKATFLCSLLQEEFTVPLVKISTNSNAMSATQQTF